MGPGGRLVEPYVLSHDLVPLWLLFAPAGSARDDSLWFRDSAETVEIAACFQTPLRRRDIGNTRGAHDAASAHFQRALREPYLRDQNTARHDADFSGSEHFERTAHRTAARAGKA